MAWDMANNNKFNNMKKVIFASFLALAWLFNACQSSNNPDHQAEDQLHEEVMAIHDEVMPKMGEINKLSRELKKVAESSSNYDENVKSMASNAIQQLEQADEGMMGWMEAYQAPAKKRGEMDHAAIMQYLDAEKQKIGTVKVQMLESIQVGNAVLSEIQKAQ